MPNPILVTGAAGFAGSHLLELLAADRARDAATRVDIVGWHRPGKKPPAGNGVRWDAVDLLDRTAGAAAVRRPQPGAGYPRAGAAPPGAAWESGAPRLSGDVPGTPHLLAPP